MRYFQILAVGLAASCVAALASEPLLRLNGQEDSDRLGSAVAAGDLNRDGYADIVASAVPADGRPARVFAYSGRDGSQLRRFQGRHLWDSFGEAVAVSDINRDRFADVIVGAPGDDDYGRPGYVDVYSGRNGRLLRRLVGYSKDDGFGASVVSCDLDRDRTPDLIVTAPLASSRGGGIRGAVYAFSGKTGRLLRRLVGPRAGESFAADVACGDVDRDRFPDIVVGAPDASPGGRRNAGAVYVFSGKTGRLLQRIEGPEAIDSRWRMGLGTRVLCCDLDRDGRAEVIASAPGMADYDDCPDTGSVLVYSGKTGFLLAWLEGRCVDDGLGLHGFSLACSDLNRDGYPEILAGSVEYSASEPYPGAVYVHSMRDPGASGYLQGYDARSWFGHSIACADVNRDRVPDLITGAPWTRSTTGSVYVTSGQDVLQLLNPGRRPVRRPSLFAHPARR